MIDVVALREARGFPPLGGSASRLLVLSVCLWLLVVARGCLWLVNGSLVVASGSLLLPIGGTDKP